MWKNDIGVNAGIIWNLLREKSALTIKEIGEITGFQESFLFLSLGWLAREDKVNFFEKDNEVYLELSSQYGEIYY